MKSILKLAVFIIGCSSIFTSCQKVIDIDLNKAEKYYIVDAVITDIIGQNAISIIRSKDFDLDNTFDSIADARIWVRNITTNQNYEFSLTSGTKLYQNNNIVATPGQAYDLTIVVGDDTLKSYCEVPSQKVALDSLVIRVSEFSFFFGEDRFECVPIYQDPVGRGNYYYLKSYINGKSLVRGKLDNDDFIDGQVNKSAVSFTPMNIDSESEEDIQDFKNGDTLTVELYNISKPVYDFYATLSQNSSSVISNPINPKSNVLGKNTIGVFNVATISRKTIIAEF
jgi:hypothetical protein